MDHLGLWRERIVAAVPETHDLAARKSICWNDIASVQGLVARNDPGPELAAQVEMNIAFRIDRSRIVWHDVDLEDSRESCRRR
jgi:hypothetical protein